MFNRRVFLAAAAASTASLKHVPAVSQGPESVAELLLADTSSELFSEYPDCATYLGVDTGPKQMLTARLSDRSKFGDAARASSCAKRLQRLKTVDSRNLSGELRVSLETVTYAHELADEGYRAFPFGDNAVLGTWQAQTVSPYIVSQASGSFATMPDFLTNQHRVEARADAEAYLERLRGFARNLGGETEAMRVDAAKGVTPPDFILDVVITQQEQYLANPTDRWDIATSLSTRARAKQILGEWGSAAAAICRDEVRPALERQLAALKALRQSSEDKAGCWKFPEGAAYYAWTLRSETTTPQTPEDVYQLGLSQVRGLESQMDAALRSLDLRTGSVGERMAHLGEDPRFLFANDDAGRDQLIAYLNDRVAKVRPALPRMFKQDHNAKLIIKSVPQSTQLGAPAAFEVDGPLDGSQPSTYFINLQTTARWPRFILPTLCYHEGIPGHVWQGSYTRGLPLIRSQLGFNAYNEGWGLYAEQLADEFGMYEDDPVGRLGYLQSLCLRACRLVVDTGIHYKRWTREQAIQWFIDHTGNTREAATREINRYCVWPGQACGYRIGQLRINAQRDRMQAELGGHYDVRDFNDLVLSTGPVPLDVLQRVVDRYIAREAGHRA